MATPLSIAIIGTGPAALMAAETAISRGASVAVYEKRSGPARKLLIAGSSGLNITHSEEVSHFASRYTGWTSEQWLQCLNAFSPSSWRKFIEEKLGIPTFVGTSDRCFVENMKAAKLVQTWVNRLKENGVQFFFEQELLNLEKSSQQWKLTFSSQSGVYDRVGLALGGGSWEEVPPRWPKLLTSLGLTLHPFAPSNCGFHLNWSEAFLKEAEGLPLKNIELHTSRGSRKGELVVTSYGLEGTPIYAIGETGEATLDLKPSLSFDQILARCGSTRENLSPIRRIKSKLNLCPASLALLFHGSTPSERCDLPTLVQKLKKFPLQLGERRPLLEAISSAGGLSMSELNDDLMVRKLPGVFAAGEMLDWDAPTGGYLIQGCVSQGFLMGHGLVKRGDS